MTLVSDPQAPQPPAAEAARPMPPGATFPGPAAFRGGEGGPEDRLIAQLAFAMAAESGNPPRGPEAIQALRDQAAAALSDFAFRYLHNRAEEIRREAATEALAKAPRPPGFVTLVVANLIALGLAGAAGLFLAANPAFLAGLTGH